MEILGIGMPELIFIVLIALIVLGPKDMEKTGRTIGVWLRKIVLSPEWRALKDASRRIGTLPNKWMREANQDLQKVQSEIKNTIPDLNTLGSWGGEDITLKTPENPPAVITDEVPDETAAPEAGGTGNTIAPPASDDAPTEDLTAETDDA
ncbi:MAG: hypothetical protein GXP40_07800 [Chloroflexi bacterium]|nr:hypothetical protein [Chloroflexota bacterium]